MVWVHLPPARWHAGSACKCWAPASWCPASLCFLPASWQESKPCLPAWHARRKEFQSYNFSWGTQWAWILKWNSTFSSWSSEPKFAAKLDVFGVLEGQGMPSIDWLQTNQTDWPVPPLPASVRSSSPLNLSRVRLSRLQPTPSMRKNARRHTRVPPTNHWTWCCVWLLLLLLLSLEFSSSSLSAPSPCMLLLWRDHKRASWPGFERLQNRTHTCRSTLNATFFQHLKYSKLKPTGLHCTQAIFANLPA